MNILFINGSPNKAGTGDWQEGQRFRSSASEDDVRAWVEVLVF